MCVEIMVVIRLSLSLACAPREEVKIGMRIAGIQEVSTRALEFSALLIAPARACAPAPSRAERARVGPRRGHATRMRATHAAPLHVVASPCVYRPLPYTASAYARERRARARGTDSEREREGDKRHAIVCVAAELDNSGPRVHTPRANAPSRCSLNATSCVCA